MARKSIERLTADAADALRRYHEGGQHDTDLLRAAAGDVVELRSRFHRDKDGLPDWSGRTTRYRDAIAEVFHRAGLKPRQVEALQRKLGYHVRLTIDAREIPAEDLEATGIEPTNPKVRQTRKRATDAAIAAAFAPETTAADRAVFAERLLAQAASEDIGELPPRHLAVIGIAMDGIATYTENLRAAVAEADAG